jgi:hypothetical protein
MTEKIEGTDEKRSELAVADLVPTQEMKTPDGSAVDEMRDFIRSHKMAVYADVDLKALTNEGRA